jgi:hypothetical protein
MKWPCTARGKYKPEPERQRALMAPRSLLHAPEFVNEVLQRVQVGGFLGAHILI